MKEVLGILDINGKITIMKGKTQKDIKQELEPKITKAHQDYPNATKENINLTFYKIK